jgi:hypothetical protein
MMYACRSPANLNGQDVAELSVSAAEIARHDRLLQVRDELHLASQPPEFQNSDRVVNSR